MTDEQIANVKEWIEETCASYCIPRPFAIIELLSASKTAAQGGDMRALIAGYRRGIQDAFHSVNMMNANRQGRTDKETCSYIVRALAEMANSGEVPAAPAQSVEPVAWPYEITRGHIECLINDHQRDGQKQLKHGLNSSGSYLIRVAESFRWCLDQIDAAPQPSQPVEAGETVANEWKAAIDNELVTIESTADSFSCARSSDLHLQ